MSQEVEKVNCLIIGSGPAGYTAAIYTSRADLKPVLYQGIEPGGQLMITTDVENYPGYPEGVKGPQMMEDFKKQAQRFGTDIRYGIVTQVDFSKRPFKIEIDKEKNLLAKTVIIATGASAKWLGLPSEQRLNGYGVSACAVCDGYFFRGQDVVVVGGGDTAGEEATYLAKLCKKVFLVHRRNELRASKAMQHRVFNTKNIEMVWEHEVAEVIGEKGVEGVDVKNVSTRKITRLPVTGLFIAIGHTPNSEVFKGWLDMDETGYLKVQNGSTRTNVPGVFACGDVMDKVYRQAVSAAGTGCMAALDAERFLASQEI